ncbi:MAG: hypothetical protein F6J92_27985 [Symploca sp. SIO1A3]|nr:hypothetical protein [Symploca sp. SIO2C1]NER50443.1 hypothetical protein [Symploca sp. SIO1A3]
MPTVSNYSRCLFVYNIPGSLLRNKAEGRRQRAEGRRKEDFDLFLPFVLYEEFMTSF